MNALEILLGRRWVLKSRDRELYYRMKDEVGSIRRFLTEKLGYQVIVNPYMVKVEKLPAKAENWMGILEFTQTIEYVFFCLILMFLEEKDAGEQFVLSQLTEYIQGQYKEEQIDWTIYRYRRHLIRVLKYCVTTGILNVDDGSEENFAKDDGNEVLYENTGVSKYFMKHFTQDMMNYTSISDFEGEEWIDINEDRGIVRRQRVYRQLLMTMGMYKTEENEEDFAYIRNYRNMIQGELSELLDCELEVHRTSAFLVLGEECRMGRCFPEENTLSDIVLLINGMIVEKIADGTIDIGADEKIQVPEEVFNDWLEMCKEKFGHGWIKSYREMTTGDFCEAVRSYMLELGFIRQEHGEIVISTAVGKVVGHYPNDFLENGGRDE